MPALNQRILSGLFFITMKNTFQISKQQITYLHEISGDSTRLSLEEMFPEAFEPELKTGIWYKSTNQDKFFFFLEEILSTNEINRAKAYGFTLNGEWDNSDVRSIYLFKNHMTPATEEEVFERLKEEAVKRGFKKGVTVDREWLNNEFESIVNIILEGYKYFKHFNRLELGSKIIFDNGKWAEICITKEDAEKEIGKKII